jgi:hypothetical protein
VLERIQELKAKTPKAYLCTHLNPSPEIASYDPQNNYYDLYWKQYLLNDLGIRHAQLMQKEVIEFERKLKKIDVYFFLLSGCSNKGKLSCSRSKHAENVTETSSNAGSAGNYTEIRTLFSSTTR